MEKNELLLFNYVAKHYTLEHLTQNIDIYSEDARKIILSHCIKKVQEILTEMVSQIQQEQKCCYEIQLKKLIVLVTKISEVSANPITCIASTSDFLFGKENSS